MEASLNASPARCATTRPSEEKASKGRLDSTVDAVNLHHMKSLSPCTHDWQLFTHCSEGKYFFVRFDGTTRVLVTPLSTAHTSELAASALRECNRVWLVQCLQQDSLHISHTTSPPPQCPHACVYACEMQAGVRVNGEMTPTFQQSQRDSL